MVCVLQPHTIIVYGSANYKCFEELKKQGIHIAGLKIKSYSSFAVVVKIIKEYGDYPFSEIKARIDKNDYLLCYECADRFGSKK